MNAVRGVGLVALEKPIPLINYTQNAYGLCRSLLWLDGDQPHGHFSALSVRLASFEAQFCEHSVCMQHMARICSCSRFYEFTDVCWQRTDQIDLICPNTSTAPSNRLAVPLPHRQMQIVRFRFTKIATVARAHRESCR